MSASKKNVYKIVGSSGQELDLSGVRALLDGENVIVQPDMDAVSAYLQGQINTNNTNIDSLSATIGTPVSGENYDAVNSSIISNHLVAIDDRIGENIDGEFLYCQSIEFNSASELLLIQAPTIGAHIVEANLFVSTAFDGTVPTLSLGTSANNQLFLDTNSFDLTSNLNQPQIVNMWETIGTSDNVNLYLTSNGSTVGSAKLIIRYINNGSNSDAGWSKLKINNEITRANANDLDIPSSNAIREYLDSLRAGGQMISTTNQTVSALAAAPDIVLLDTINLENNIDSDVTNNKFTVLYNGIYEVNCSVNGTYDDTFMALQIRKNGVVIEDFVNSDTTGENITGEYQTNISISTLIDCNHLDEIDFRCYKLPGGSNPVINKAQFSISRIIENTAANPVNPEDGILPTLTTYAVNSATFNGLTSFAEAPASVASALQIGTQEFTVNVWVKSTNTSNAMQIINCDSGSPNYFDCYTFDDLGTPRMEFRSGSDRIQIDATNLLDGNWHLLSCIKDNDTGLTQDGRTGEFRVYLDGSVQTPTFVDRLGDAENLNVFSNTEPITFGRRSYTNSLYFDGNLSFASFHVGTVLTPAQLVSEYNGGTPKCFADSPNESTITEGWNLGNYHGNSGSEYTGYKGIQDLTTVTSVTLTGTGLNVECTQVAIDPTLVNSSHFRLHAVDVNNPPVSQVAYSTSLDITSAINSSGSFYLLTTVPKADLEGNHIYLDLELTADYTGESIRRNVLLLEGTVEGDDPMFVNGQHITPDFTVSTGGTNSQFNERVVYNNPVPDITSVTDPNMTICIELYDSWTLLNIDWSIHNLQVRTPSGDIVKNVVLSNPIYKTGETLPSKSGVITDEAVVPYVPPNVTLTDALNGVTGPFLQTYDVHNALGSYVRTIHYGTTASRDNSPHEGWSINGSYLASEPNISYYVPYPGNYYLYLTGDQQFSSFINSTDGLAGMNFSGFTVIPSVYF